MEIYSKIKTILLTLIGIGLILGIIFIVIEVNDNISDKRQLVTLRENLPKGVIDLGIDSTSNHALVGNLKLKFKEGQYSSNDLFGDLLYVVKITTQDKKYVNPLIYSFTIELLDSDGFKIEEINLKDYTSFSDENGSYGIVVNSSLYPFRMSNYLKIAEWHLLYQEKALF